MWKASVALKVMLWVALESDPSDSRWLNEEQHNCDVDRRFSKYRLLRWALIILGSFHCVAIGGILFESVVCDTVHWVSTGRQYTTHIPIGIMVVGNGLKVASAYIHIHRGLTSTFNMDRFYLPDDFRQWQNYLTNRTIDILNSSPETTHCLYC